MNSVYVLNFCGLRGFDDTCMELTVKLLHKYQRIVCINLCEVANVSASGWDMLVQGLRAPECGIIAASVESRHDEDVLPRLVKDAIREHRLRAEADARGLLAAAAHESQSERQRMIRRVSALVPWRSDYVWVHGRKRPGVGASIRASPFASNVDVWWANPFWRPTAMWDELVELNEDM